MCTNIKISGKKELTKDKFVKGYKINLPFLNYGFSNLILHTVILVFNVQDKVFVWRKKNEKSISFASR